MELLYFFLPNAAVPKKLQKLYFFLNYYFFQLGPEKGVIHLATAAIVNALWDLWAKMENKVN